MNWESELWVKIYCRDTGDWLALSFEAQAVWLLLLRKVARDGTLDLGRSGKLAIAMVIGHKDRWSSIEPAVEELLKDGCLRIEGDIATIPNFVQAQLARSAAAVKQKAWRDRHSKRNALPREVTVGNALPRVGQNRIDEKRRPGAEVPPIGDEPDWEGN